MYDLLCEYFGSDAVEGFCILLLAVPLIGWRIAVAMEGKTVPGFWKTHVQRLGRVGVSFGILCILFFAYAQQKEEQQQAQQQAVVEVFTSISEVFGPVGEAISNLRNWLTPEEKKSRLLPVGLATNATAWVAESQCVTSQVREAWQRVPIRRAAFRQTLPFPVTVGDHSYEEVFISSSGVIGFDAPKGSELTREMPYEEAADHVYLALLWGRIDFKPRLGSKMWCGVKTNGNFVASYDTVFVDGDTNAIAKVQVEFIAGGDMIMRYADLPSCATNAHRVGFQNLDGGWTLPFDNIHSNTALYLKSFGQLDLTVEDSDTDGDGISDYYELYPTNGVSITDPCNRDSDGDGLMDGEEVALYATDPGAFSSDASGEGDLWRVLGGLGPSDAPYTNAAPSGSVGILTVTTLLEGATTNGGAVLRIADQYIPVLFGTTLVSRIAVPRDVTNLFILARGVNCDNAIAHITLESSTFTKIRDPSGALSGSFTLSPSCVTASGTILMPSYTITPEFICFHSPTSSVLRIESADPDIYFNMGQGLVREYTPSKPENLPPDFTIGAVTGRLTCAGNSYTVLSNQFTKAAHFCNTEGPGGWEDPNDPDDREDWWCHTDVYGHVVEYPFTESDCPCIILYENSYDCFCSGRGVTPCPCGHAVCDPHATPADEPHDGPPYKQTREHATLEIGGDTVFFPVTVPQGEYEPCPRCKCGMNLPLCAYAFRQTGNIDVAPLALYTNGSFAVTGIHPSTNFAAEVLTVHLKDTYIQQSYTVLGTSVYPADTGHSVSNWFIGCGITNALTLWTGVKLPSDTGEVTLSVTVDSGTPAPQLYVYNRIAQSNELLVSQENLTYTQNLGDWRDTYCDTNGYTQAWLLCTNSGVGRVMHSYETYSGQPHNLSCSAEQAFTSSKADLDIRETAQPQNRVGRDDPRILARVRNRILVWANSGGNTITFDVIKPPDITGPVWIQIEDRNALNSGMPHYERLDVPSATFTYTVAVDNDEADLLVRYGADINSDGTLSGTNEVKGTYEVYGVTTEEYAESANNYIAYLGVMSKLGYQLQHRFAYGRFNTVWPGGYEPTSFGSATLSAERLTHYFGANLADAGFVSLGGRQYYAATAAFPIYHYADNSDASELIRNSDELLEGLGLFVNGLAYSTVASAYATASGGVTRAVSLSLDGVGFQFGAIGSIGLGGVGVHSASPYSSAGTITLQVTLGGSNYTIGVDAVVDLTLHDVFDFDYFTPGGLANYSDSSRSAGMIQNGFNKTGSTLYAGQVGLVEVEVDGSVTVTERIITP